MLVLWRAQATGENNLIIYLFIWYTWREGQVRRSEGHEVIGHRVSRTSGGREHKSRSRVEEEVRYNQGA